MRVRGGSRGLLSAIEAGRLDPLDGWLPDERDLPNLTPSELAKIKRRHKARDRRRSKQAAARLPF